MKFKEKLRLIKEVSGLNQIKFSESIDMNYAHCNKFFTGRKPNVDFLNKLIKGYPDVNIRWLIQDDWETDEVIYEGQKSSQRYLKNIVEIQKQKIEPLAILTYSDVKSIYDFLDIRKNIVFTNPEKFEDGEIHEIINKQKIVWQELHSRTNNIKELRD